MWFAVVLALAACPPPPELAGFNVSPERNYQVGDLPIDLEVRAVDEDGQTVVGFCGAATIDGLTRTIDGRTEAVTRTPTFVGGVARLERVHVAGDAVTVSAGPTASEWRPDLRHIPGIVSLLPPVIAILLAIVTRQALLALLGGIWVGGVFVYDYHPLKALFKTFDTHLVSELASHDHAAIILFTMALGGLAAILAKSGASRALVDAISKRARGRRAGMLTSWFGGLAIFFDDYTNCLLVGSTLRPFTDRLHISREKLAYIVDSTAAPVATVAIISTWIGFQLERLAEVTSREPYDLFLDILPYSFYSLITILFVFAIAVSTRDFGPMLTAERRAASGGGVLRPGAQPLMSSEVTDMEPSDGVSTHWLTAVLPIIALIIIVIVGMVVTGVQNAPAGATLRQIMSKADTYAVLIWAAFGGGAIAFLAARATGALSFGEAIEAWMTGVKSMAMAIAILILAWGIGTMCKEYLMTGDWVLSQFSPSPHLLPTITFIICAVIAFATGSSFSTMGIVIPIAGPMAWAVTGEASMLEPGVVESIRYATLAAVLSGAVFGDHCSPISDTTVMSSMASACDHIDHVRTQIPYAMTCAAIAILFGYLPSGYGVSPWVTLPLGIAAAGAVVFLGGRQAARPETN